MAATPRRRCAQCGNALRARDKFCPSCGTPLEGAPVRPTRSTVDSASLQVSHVARAALGEQRKVVTILFADLSGSTVLGERLDPEELRGVLTSYFNELSRQIQRYEGTIDKYVGDAVMAVFGAPISHEDDAERAINAALAMQQSIGHLNEDLDRRHHVRLSLRIGINTGQVVAGLLAGDVQSAYTVVGDAVNTAQRFEAAAPLGEILVSADTRRLAIHSFEFEQTAPLTLKGKAERVVGYRVLRRRYEEIAPEATQFIGRTAEIDHLRRAITDAVLGRGRVVNIIGEAGVGKSRLVGELRANLVSGIDRMTVRCASFETNTPYALLSDFIRGAFSFHAADDEATARAAITNGFAALGEALDEADVTLLLDVLGYSVNSPLDPEVKRRILVKLMTRLLQLAGDRAPFVLTAEDLHWVDRASLRVLEELVANIPSLPCLFITTTRPGWTPPWKSESITVRPLDAKTARELIEAVFEVPVDDDLAEAILVRTSGNPFFIEEVVRDLKQSNLLVEHTGRVGLVPGATAPVPATVQEVIEARLDRLGAKPRRALNAGAICGRTFWVRVLERLLPDLALRPHLATLERENFIDLRTTAPEITYGFRQILIQEVAYQNQLQVERRRSHGAVASAIEALYGDRLEEFIDLLAYHYSRSNDATKAVDYLMRAGVRAQRLYANEEALTFYRAALEWVEERKAPGDVGGILERMADVEIVIAKFDDALVSLGRAQEHASSSGPVAARLKRKIGTALLLKGAYGEAIAALEDARTALGTTVDIEGARIGVRMGEVLSRSGNYARAREALERAVAEAEVHKAEDVAAEGLHYLGGVLGYSGDLRGATNLYRRCLEIYERLENINGAARVYMNLGGLYRRLGRFDEALAQHHAALALAERMGNRWLVALCHANIGEVYKTRGDLAATIASKERALKILTVIGSESEAAQLLMEVGFARVRQGEIATGRAELLEAESRLLAIGSLRHVPELYRALAYAALADGDLIAAERAAGHSLDYACRGKARQEEAITQRTLGEIALARGDVSEARSLLETSRDRLRELGEVAELGFTEGLLQRLSEKAPAR
jgi:predicted ATPase/class 3 adenylate cyclase